MKIKTAAKINLALDVIGRLPDGYHSIEGVFQTVGLYDEIEVNISDDIAVSCELPEEFASADSIPCDERNIAYKAAKLFIGAYGGTGCSIHIKKGIPSQAGMGGGSTDAAAVLHCMNVLSGSPASDTELAALGKKLGADVPFFFTGGTAYVGGIGEKVQKIADYSGHILVIAKGREGVSTAEAYRSIDALTAPVHPQTDKLVQALEETPDAAYKYFGNLFEQAITLAEVDDIKSKMMSDGALNAVMTGSGSAVFGLFTDRSTAEKCARALADPDYFAAVCETAAESFVTVEG